MEKTAEASRTQLVPRPETAVGLVAQPASAVGLLPGGGKGPDKRRWRKPGLLALLLLAAIGGGTYWWLNRPAGLPPGLASGNGRLDADEIDIDTKFAGRIVALYVDEGDLTTGGQVLAKMDTRDLEASLMQARAMIDQAGKTLEAASATLEQQKSQVLFGQQEIARTLSLVDKGFATREALDQRRQVLVSAIAGQNAAEAVIGQSKAALDAATHAAQVYQVNIADDLLLSPRDGRIEYRVANVGEVLPAGGKVFTMLDTGYVYMDIYLPTSPPAASNSALTLGSSWMPILGARSRPKWCSSHSRRSSRRRRLKPRTNGTC